jgi:hypothetical protein
MLNKKEVTDAFMNIQLEENYNFLEQDLIDLANAFVKVAAPKIVKAERNECIEFVRSLNHLVADKLQEKRGKL